MRKVNRKWDKSNREVVYKNRASKRTLYSHLHRKYMLRKSQACPEWLTDEDLEKIHKLYEHAKDCYLVSGQKYHVDHIVPLQGKNVCGLHVPWNLQILPDYVNYAKGNNNIW